MKKRKFILGCLAGLVFMVFTAVNVTVSQSYQKDGSMAQLSLVDLTAKAQTGDECDVQCDRADYEDRCKTYEGGWPTGVCIGWLPKVPV